MSTKRSKSSQEKDEIRDPRVGPKTTLLKTPWCDLVEMRANIDDGHGEQAFYAIESNDYLGVVAVTPQGLYPLVHQLRPVAGFVTCELPAGTVETGETPEAAARREMLEETGLRVRKLTKLGTHCSDSGRLTNRIHSFFAETDSPDPNFKPEPGLTVEYVSKSELIRRVKLGEIHQLLHVGAVLLALLD